MVDRLDAHERQHAAAGLHDELAQLGQASRVDGDMHEKNGQAGMAVG